MNYYKYDIRNQAEHTEILIALLGQYAFDSFQESDHGLEAFVPEKDNTPELESNVKELQAQFAFQFEKVFIPYKNWNEVWESNFQPILIRDFCGIRADFHPTIDTVKHELVINPKMAFGTGHHETTYMVSDLMEVMPFQAAKVLDYGCGTGILAILASRLGAISIDAVDIEQASYENTIENAAINKVENIKCIHGTLDDIKDEGYDIILANINRNVILDSLPALHKKLKIGGKLVISGFIEKDEAIMQAAVLKNRFNIDTRKQRKDWLCYFLTKLV